MFLTYVLTDINECEKEDTCKDNQYCQNEAGSHSCEGEIILSKHVQFILS